jgi:hypothetical protein
MKNIEIVEWLKTQIDKKFQKDFDLKEIKAYLSCDRPNPDLIVECSKANGDREIIRFLIV